MKFMIETAQKYIFILSGFLFKLIGKFMRYTTTSLSNAVCDFIGADVVVLN